MINNTARLARRLIGMDKRLSAQERSAQAAYRSVESGAIEVNDADGNTVGTVGQMPGGRFGAVDLVMTEPPHPTDPGVVAAADSIAVSWDGGFADSLPTGVTVAYVGVHVNQEPGVLDWEPTVSSEVAQIPFGGGSVIVPGDAGVETEILLVTASAAGVWSAPTAPVVVTPSYAVTVDDIPPSSDGAPPPSSPPATVAPFGIGAVRVTWPDNTAPGEDPRTYNVHASLTSPVTAADEVVATTSSLAVIFDRLNGARLPMTEPGTPVYAAVFASDADGPAVAGIGATGSGVARRAGIGDIEPIITGKNRTFVQSAVPSALAIGDLWINPDDGYQLKHATALGTGSWADAGQASEKYVASRGTNLITNGSGLLGNDTNFSFATFDTTDMPTGASGAFDSGPGTSYQSDELIPVDPALAYELSAQVKQKSGSGNFYLGVAPYDAFGLNISPVHYMAQVGTKTTLAAALNPGDTTITLTSAAGWNNAAGSSTWLRSLIVWNYVDPGGKAWPEDTYSRNFYTDIYADGAIVGNTITLRVPWAGPAIASGTKLSNGSSGGTYLYLVATNAVMPTDWTRFSGQLGPGIHPSGTPVYATTKLPMMTANVKVLFLPNRAPVVAPSQQSFALLSLSEINRIGVGGILEENIAANAVVAGKILAGSVGSREISADYAYVGWLEANKILSGVIDAFTSIGLGAFMSMSEPSVGVTPLTGGFVVNDPANPSGEPIVRLHPEGCTFRGEVITDVLTVMQDLIVNGVMSLSSGASAEMQNGVSNPTVAPAMGHGPLVAQSWPAVSGGVRKGICWDATGGQWVEIFTRTSDNATVYRTVSTAGVAGTMKTMATSVASLSLGSASFSRISSVTVVGSSIFTFAIYWNASLGQEQLVIHKASLSTGARQGEVYWGAASAANEYDPGIGNDGTHLVSVRWFSTINMARVYRYDTSLNYVGHTILTGSPSGGGGDLNRFVGIGDYGYGSSKLTIAHDGKVDVYPIPAFTEDSVAFDAALSFEMDQTIDSGGIAYKTSGTNQAFYSTHNDLKLWKWSTYYPPASEKQWSKYIDTAGADHTAPSPVASIAVGKRRYAIATLRPAPSGVTSADVYTGYGSVLPTTFYKRPEALNGRTLAMTSLKDVTGQRMKTVAVTSKALTTNVATLGATAHDLLVGQAVTVSGVDATFNGVYTITAVAANTFSYAKVAANVTSVASGGSATTIPTNTLGGTPFELGSEIGGLIAKGDGTFAAPKQDQRIVPTLTNGTGITELVVAQWALPAGYLIDDLIAEMHLIGQVSAGATLTWRIRCGPLGTTADPLVVEFAATAAGGANSHFSTEFILACLTDGAAGTITGAGRVFINANPTTVNGPTPAVFSAAAVNTTVAQKISVTLQHSVSQTTTVRAAVLQRLRG